MKFPGTLLACILCGTPSPPPPDIPYAVEINTQGLPNPRSDSEYSLTPAIIEEHHRVLDENARLKRKVQELQRRVNELEEGLVMW